MDSMRTLNTSLPRASPRRRAIGQQPPEELLSAFKAAALSVTNLYKTAASDQVRARAAGYQNALDDLLALLDRENLGLGDGEGWRVRQWATERLDGTVPGRGDSDEEEDAAEEEKEKARSSSPELSRRGRQASNETHEASHPPILPESTAALPPPQQEAPGPLPPSPPVPHANIFTFRSSHAYPTNHDREVDMDNASVASDTPVLQPSTDAAHPTIRAEIAPKQARNRHHGRANNNRPAPSGLASMGASAGAKRKTPFGDFFDISGLSFDGGNGKDGSGRGGKRGRHV